MKRRKLLMSMLLVPCFLFLPPNGSSCGPYFPDPVFVNRDRPGRPLQWYAEGDLGVLLPGFSRGDLVIAYRYLAGRPLSKAEQNGVLSYWRWKYERDWSQEGTLTQEWLSARRQALGAGSPAPMIDNYRPAVEGFGGMETCLADSFHTAALTLKNRVQRFADNQPALNEWIKGQDAVFHSCGFAKDVPDPLADDSPAWLKADRRYQIAAAHFYSGSFDRAAQDFDQIAGDNTSPWQGLAPYLAARAMIRKGTLTAPFGEEAMRNAEARLKKVIDDPSQSPMHHAAQRLEGFIALRMHREERNLELARLLAGPKPDRDFQQDLIDYAWSLDHLANEPPERGPEAPGATEEYRRRYQEWAKGRDRRWLAAQGANDMTDWIVKFQASDPEALDHALAVWRKQHALPWLVAAISKVGPKDQSATELLQAAENVAVDSPAYPTLQYHRARLLMQAGENKAARALLDALLASSPERLSGSSRNLFLAQRMRLANTFRDFLSHAPRPVADVDYEDGLPGMCEGNNCDDLLYDRARKEKTELRFDGDAASVINLRLPLDMMAEAGTSPELPEPLRGETAVAAWTRAVMLERHDLAVKLVPEIEKAYPSIKQKIDEYAAANPDDRNYAALFVILHFPGMRPYVNIGAARREDIEKIDSYRDNWWCADLGANAVTNYEKAAIGGSLDKPTPPREGPYPAFLSAEQARAAESEWQTLSKSDSGDIYLTRQTLAWAHDRPQDPRLPEALHLAVRSTRYGCGEKGVSSLSKKAFQLLHEKFPDSKWTKQTPYWF